MRFRLLKFIAVVVLAGAAVLDAIQERPARPTRSWRAYELPGIDWRLGSAVVDVIDTEGVCLYVVRAYSPSDVSPAIAAVPKTQLPAGAGCQ